MNKDVRVTVLKDDLENLNAWKRTSRRIISDILSKNSENQELNPKFKLQSFQRLDFSIDTISYVKKPTIASVICRQRYYMS